jgi:hypothetical protein
MKLSQIFENNMNIMQPAKLLVSLKLDDGTVLKKNSKGHLMIDYGNGWYHFENNDGACKVKAKEVMVVAAPKTKKRGSSL